MVCGVRLEAWLRLERPGSWQPFCQHEVRGLDLEGSGEPWEAEEGRGWRCPQEKVRVWVEEPEAGDLGKLLMVQVLLT